MEDIPDKRPQLGGVPTFYTTDPDHLGMEQELGIAGTGDSILDDLRILDPTVVPLPFFEVINRVLSSIGIEMFGAGLVFGGALSVVILEDQLEDDLPREIAGRLVYWRSDIPDRSQTYGVKLRTPSDMWRH